jgi:hypothetical protein
MTEDAESKTSDKDETTSTEASKNTPPPAPNEGRLGPAADPAEGKRE